MRHPLTLSAIVAAIVAGACNAGGHADSDVLTASTWRDSSAEVISGMMVTMDSPVDAASMVIDRLGEVSTRDEAVKVVEVTQTASRLMTQEKRDRFAAVVDSLVLEVDAARLARFVTLLWSPSEIGSALSPDRDEWDRSFAEAVKARYDVREIEEFERALNR
ncbi:MAG: hypothetical protein NC117_03870 [Pseudoflavonifractor sp.]|nr:hypothetical protein [Pseudoflavonifractor sp.]